MQRHQVLVPGAFIIVLAACAAQTPPPPLEYSVTIDPMLADMPTDAITAAVDAWNQAIPQLHLTYMIAPCNSPSPQQVCLHPEFDPPNPPKDIVGTTFRGASDSGTVWIFVARLDALATDAMGLTRQTAEHELGHAMGLQHAATGTLMAADVSNQAPGITPADIAQFWAVRGQ
jgi:hypothetical protein